MSRGSRTIPLPEPVRRDNQPLGREIGHGERKLCSLKGTGVCEDGKEGRTKAGEGGAGWIQAKGGREREREGPIPRSVRQNLSSYETIFSQGELPAFPAALESLPSYKGSDAGAAGD